MNEGNASRFSEWVWRRWEQPLSFRGHELSPYTWLVILGVVLAAAFFYVGWMYIKDSRSVGPWWATFLGLLRSTVYVVLAAVFMLPAQENFEVTTLHSKVVTIHDVSGSMTDTYDDPTTAGVLKLSRQDKHVNFLLDPKINFYGELEKKNPVTIYRFAQRGDEDYIYLVDGRFYTRTEWETKQQEAPKVVVNPRVDLWNTGSWKKWGWNFAGGAILILGLLAVMARFSSFTSLEVSERVVQWVLLAAVLGVGGWFLYNGYQARPAEDKPAVQITSATGEQPTIEARPLSDVYLRSFFNMSLPAKAPANLSKEDKKALKERVEQNESLRKSGFFDSTAVGDSTLALFNREQNNKLQGIVVFSDGHNTSGSTQAYRELAENARNAKIPIFVVGIGKNRPHVKTDVVEVVAPAKARPEDKFPVVVEVTGQGLPEKELPVQLIVTNVTKGKNGKEELLPITLRQAPDPKDATAKRAEMVLGKEIILQQTVKLDRGAPPRGRIEFRLDAQTLAEAAGQKPDTKMKWGLGETRDSELHFSVRVPKDKAEILNPDDKFAVSKAPAELRVEEKPLRVLLFASAPTREYQFLRTLLVREMESKRLELSIHLQLPPGSSERRTGVVQDVPKERLLDIFPNTYGEGKDSLFDLANYDVIIAFDPDWTQLSRETLVLLAGDEKEKRKGWVDRGGGLIVIGGPINTIQLARPSDNKDKIQLVRELYPVVPKDYRIEDDDRDTKDPHALLFSGASPEMAFLNLEESEEPNKFLQGWKEFFNGTSDTGEKVDPTKVPMRGFYNFFPVEKVKQQAQVVARFLDDKARMADKERSFQPFMVITDKASGRRVIWLGAGETWRLRSYKEAYHERFWTKLIRFAGANSMGTVKRRMELVVGSEQKVNQPVLIEAHVDGDNGRPLDPDVKPEITLHPPVGVQGLKVNFTMKAKPGREGWFTTDKPVQVPASGKYGLDLSVPGIKEVQHAWFQATAPNLEKEETQPDFANLYYLASEAQEVLDRMTNEADKRLLRESLRPPRMDDSAGERGVKEGKMRLFFTLDNANLIPKCMGEEISRPKVRLPYKDVWDEGWTLRKYNWDTKTWSDWEYNDKPVKVSWVLTLIVGLLSMEWLTRKLLRLA